MYKKILSIITAIIYCINTQAQTLTFSEVNYKSDITLDGGDWVEIRNYGASPVDISGYSLVDSAVGSIPYVFTSTIIPANAAIVVFGNISKFNSFYTTVTNKKGPFAFKLNSIDRISLKDPLGATVLQMDYSNKFPWPPGADGEGRTLEKIDQNSNTNLSLPTSWLDGCMSGSPGQPKQACVDNLIFTEINYNSNDTFDQGEFVEIYNNTNAPIDLFNYYLRDAFDTIGASSTNTFYFPANTIIAANDYLVVSNDSQKTRKFHQAYSNKIIGNFNFNLNNGGELVKIYRKTDLRLHFSNHYNDTLPWPVTPDGDGYTLELKLKNGLYNDGTNWFAGCKLGSPGRAYDANCGPVYPDAITHVNRLDNVNIFPNPTTEAFTVSHSLAFETVELYNVTGKLLRTYDLSSNTIISLKGFEKGVYLARINGKDQLSKTFKVILQ
jgi:hypothetical protein